MAEETIKVENAVANREGGDVIFELTFCGRSYMRFAMDPEAAAFFGQWLKDEARKTEHETMPL